jgi:hypothetical protein
MKKIGAIFAAIVIFLVVGGTFNAIEGLWWRLCWHHQILFPNLSATALANIESISNIVGLALAIWLSIKTYKRLSKPRESVSSLTGMKQE